MYFIQTRNISKMKQAYSPFGSGPGAKGNWFRGTCELGDGFNFAHLLLSEKICLMNVYVFIMWSLPGPFSVYWTQTAKDKPACARLTECQHATKALHCHLMVPLGRAGTSRTLLPASALSRVRMMHAGSGDGAMGSESDFEPLLPAAMLYHYRCVASLGCTIVTFL